MQSNVSQIEVMSTSILILGTLGTTQCQSTASRCRMAADGRDGPQRSRIAPSCSASVPRGMVPNTPVGFPAGFFSIFDYIHFCNTPEKRIASAIHFPQKAVGLLCWFLQFPLFFFFCPCTFPAFFSEENPTRLVLILF